MHNIIFNMKNIYILPTEKYSDLVYSTNKYGGYFLSKYYSPMKDMGDSYQNIYITSDEEIKEGDWFVVELFKITGESDGLHIEKCTKLDDVWCNNFDVISTRHKDNCKKIILTTDQDLINDGIQAINDEFLEWFIKNPSCEEVEVKLENYYSSGALQPNLWQHKIIIPKEEPTISEEAKQRAANYMSLKGALEPKQETPESMIQEIATHLGKTIPETLEHIEKFSKDLDKLKKNLNKNKMILILKNKKNVEENF